MNTIIIEKTPNGEVHSDIFSKLAENRILFLYGYINDEMAADIVAALLYLDSENDEEKISIHLNSSGGDISSILMIYDTIKMINSPVETFCIGSAFGESALILSAGSKGMRYATKNSFIMINQVAHNYSRYTDMMNAKIMLEKSKKDNIKYLSALQDCTGVSIKKLKKDTEKEFYMSPDFAKKYGIIDVIIGE